MPTIENDPYPPQKKARWPIVAAIVGGIVGLLVIAGWYALQGQLVPRVEQAQQRTQSLNNIKQIVTILAERSTRRGWPDLTGKAFVLSLVGSGVIDTGQPANLTVFFSPADANRSADRVEPERWEGVTLAALRAGGDFDELTSYAGPAVALTPDRMAGGPVPIIADLHCRDVAIVGFANGAVRAMTREDLGLSRGDEIAVGPDSKSEILRALSDE